MGIDINRININQQLNEMNAALLNAALGVRGNKSAVEAFVNSPDLQGQAYDGFRTQYRNLHYPVLNGMLCYIDEMMAANNKYSERLAGLKGDYLNESALQSQIAQARKLANEAVILLPISPLIAELARKLERSLQEKLDSLYHFESSTRHIYNPANALLDNLNKGIAYIEASTCNISDGTFTYPAGLDTDWAVSLNAMWADRLNNGMKALVFPEEEAEEFERLVLLALEQYAQFDSDGNIIGYNWDAIREVLNPWAEEPCYNTFGYYLGMHKVSHEITEEQAAALALLYLGMDGDDAAKFLVVCMGPSSHSTQCWEASPNVEKVLTYARARVYLDSLAVAYANEIPAEKYKEMFGGLDHFAGTSDAVKIKNAVLNEMTQKNLIAMLNLGALEYLPKIEMENIDPDRPLFPGLTHYEEKSSLAVSFDYENNQCTLSYRANHAGVFDRDKTIVISTGEEKAAAHNAMEVLKSYIGEGEGVDMEAIMKKNVTGAVKTQLKSHVMNKAFEEMFEGAGKMAQKSTIIGINFCISVFTDIAEAEEATRGAGNQIMVGWQGQQANIFGLSLITVDAGGDSYGVLYPGSGTQNIINFINDNVMDDQYWEINSIGDSTRDEIRGILTDSFGGKLTVDDVLNRSAEVQSFFDQMPKKLKTDITKQGGNHVRNE